MQGTISQIVWRPQGKRQYGLMIYRDIDTSVGQSGSMIYSVETPSTLVEMLTMDNEWDKVKCDLLNSRQPRINVEESDDRVDSAAVQESGDRIKSSSMKNQISGSNLGVHTGGSSGVN